MQEIRGKDVIARMKEEMQKELAGMDYVPRLAIVRVGERPDDMSYERGAMKRMEGIGLRCSTYTFPESVSNEAFTKAFLEINEEEDIDGILLLRPLPKHIDEKNIEKMIDPAKDIDGISPTNISKVFAGEEDGFAPCTAEAVIETLQFMGEPLSGKRAVVIGRSMVVGKPLSMLLLKQNCTVTVCHTKTINMPDVCKGAEILVACAGQAKMVDASYVGKDAVVMDVGINVDENGKLCGDVAYDTIQDVAGAATPVPGGIGTVTTSVLAKHLIRAAKQRRNR